MSTIPGLSYLPEFIDDLSEKSLIQTIDDQPWITDLKRRVQHYGYRYDYKAKNISSDLKIGSIPQWLAFYSKRLQRQGLFRETPDQIIINEYMPGQGIAPHIDCIPCFGDSIASLSLGSACIMDFMHIKTREKFSMMLPPRSLVILNGEARYEWQHAIASRKTDRHDGHKIVRERRLSLTFRNVLL